MRPSAALSWRRRSNIAPHPRSPESPTLSLHQNITTVSARYPDLTSLFQNLSSPTARFTNVLPLIYTPRAAWQVLCFSACTH